MITIRRQTTRQTEMPANSQCFAHFCAADTTLRSTTRINLNQNTSSILRFVREHIDKVRPRGVSNTLSEYSARQPLDVQIFDGNQPVLVNKFSTQFVMEVGSLVADVDMRSLKKQNRLASSVRAFLTPCYTSMCDPQDLLPFSIVPWILYLRSVAQSRKVGQPNIDTDCIGTKGERLRFNFASKQGVPLSRLALNGQGFDGAENRTMQPDLHFADLRESESVPVQGVSDLAKGDAVVTACGSKTWIACLLLGLNAAKECLKRTVNASDRVFQCLSVNIRNVSAVTFNTRQLINLIKTANSFALYLPCVPTLLQRGIVKLAANSKRGVKFFGLALSRIDSIAECFYNCVSHAERVPFALGVG